MFLKGSALQERVTLHQPEHGGFRETYERALSAYVDAQGRAPLEPSQLLAPISRLLTIGRRQGETPERCEPSWGVTRE